MLDLKIQSTPSIKQNKKEDKTLIKKKKHGSRYEGSKFSSFRKSAKKGTIWVPRIRHNYVPMRNNSYTVNTCAHPVKNIPFVCGQSISKTHNIGLKIQETLNTIKQEKVKVTPQFKSLGPRVYTHHQHYHMSNNQTSEEVTKPPLERTNVHKRKPVDMYLLKAVFLELYEDLTKSMEKLQGLKANLKTPENSKATQNLEQSIKKRELQISVTMSLYKEVMCLRKALGIKTEKSLKTKCNIYPDETPLKHKIASKSLRQFQGGDQ